VLGDGTPFKLWGVNCGNKDCAPAPEDAEARAARYAKYGVNAVRLHKFTWMKGGIGHPEDSTRLTDEGWARLDRFTAALKERGIYITLSHIYGHRPVPGDRARLLAPDEVGAGLDGHLRGSSYGLVNFAPDLQELSIALTTHILSHRNPHTGLTRARQPLQFTPLLPPP
jgi:hypothetical protein